MTRIEAKIALSTEENLGQFVQSIPCKPINIKLSGPEAYTGDGILMYADITWLMPWAQSDRLDSIYEFTRQYEAKVRVEQ